MYIYYNMKVIFYQVFGKSALFYLILLSEIDI